MKIFDTFPFFNEIEILELRFLELYDTVDYFVIAEANRTHNGTPKEFIFEKNKSRYEKWLDKVIYVKVEDMPEYDPNDVFRLEYFQRNAIMRGLKDKAQIGDKVIVSDCDEIPNVEGLKANLDNPNWQVFSQELFYYYVNNQLHRAWGGSVMADYGTFHTIQKLRWFAIRRQFSRGGEGVIPNGRWHYSYMTGGDAKRVKEKVDLFAEKNLGELAGSVEDVARKMANHQDLYNRSECKRYYLEKIVDISKTKPKHLDEWLEKYPTFIFK